MARPRSDDKRNAVMAAAIQIIAAQGLSAPTASIAKLAGVSNGSLFTYFETKADLYNQLYLQLKSEMAATTLEGLPAGQGIREQLLATWSNWLRWATTYPEKRRALVLLGASDDITAFSHNIAHRQMAQVAHLLEKCREEGAMREAPLALVVALMAGLADATIEVILNDPTNADTYRVIAFEALWRIVA